MSPRTLQEWEQRLRSEIQEVDLLGEIPISPEESLELGRLIGDLVRCLGWQEAEQVLEREYPCSFAVHLVAQGIHGYEEGSYWEAVRESTGLSLDANRTTRWGQLFETIVKSLKVAQFPDLGGHRFVGPILAHGGIPGYCLTDFFEQIIHPLVSRPEYATLSTAEFLTERLSLPSISSLVDRPVLRFLQYGGNVAEDFVERCREMVLRTAEEGVPPAPEAVGLPRRVVEVYREWLEGRVRVSPGRRRVFRSPGLFLDPWGLGVYIHCPSQPIPATEAQMRVLWRIWTDGALQDEVLVEVCREDFDLKSDEASVPLRRPGKEYQVELVFAQDTAEGLHEEVQRIWRLPGITEERLLLLFDLETRRVVETGDVIPGGCFWVLRPPDTELLAEPSGSLVVQERLPRLPWMWSDFIAETLNLAHVSRLAVRRGSTWIAEFPVVGLEAAAQPALEGERQPFIEDGDCPLYIGPPPAIRFPSLTMDSRLHRWHIEIRNDGPAYPNVRVVKTLDALIGELNFREGYALLDLGTYLGPFPMGTYKVAVRGPLGRRADLSFRILPHLEIVGHEALYLPDALPAQITLLAEIPPDCSLEVGAKGCDVRVVDESGRNRLYEVVAEPQMGNIPLRVLGYGMADEPVRVPFTIPLRVLRWMIVLRPDEALASQWRTTLFTLSLEALEQSAEPYVFVDLFGGMLDHLSAEMHLEDVNGSSIQMQPAEYRARQRYARFDLRSFLDTLRQTEASRLALCLVLRNLPDRSEPLSIPIAQVTKRFIVEQVWGDAELEGESVNVTLRWQTAVRTRHRIVRMWPLWRSWEQPLEVPIPDEAKDQYSFVVPSGKLIPGKYLLEFETRDPWASAYETPSRPLQGAEGVFSIALPSDAAEQRLEHLACLESQGHLSFADVLERACILRELGRQEEARAAFQWCFEHLDKGTIEQILALAPCVSADPELALPLRLKMAAPHRLQRLLCAYRKGEFSQALFRQYLDLLPDYASMPLETIELLLRVDDEPTRVRAALALIERGRLTGFRAVMSWLQQGELSNESLRSIFQTVTDQAFRQDEDRDIYLVMKCLRDVFPPEQIVSVASKLVGKQLSECQASYVWAVVYWWYLKDARPGEARWEELVVSVTRRLLPRLALQKCPPGRESVSLALDWVRDGSLPKESLISFLRQQVDIAIEVLRSALPDPVAFDILERLGIYRPERIPVLVDVLRPFLPDPMALDTLGRLASYRPDQIPVLVDVLRPFLPDPRALDVLEGLGKRYPDKVPVLCVRPGYWVRCIAGWGRIERIESSEGEDVSQFPCEERKHRLHVLLRAQDWKKADRVVIDLAEGTVTFKDGQRAYTCTKCGRFSSARQELVLNDHERAAHEGVGPGYRVERNNVLRQRGQLEFHYLPPDNPWV